MRVPAREQAHTTLGLGSAHHWQQRNTTAAENNSERTHLRWGEKRAVLFINTSSIDIHSQIETASRVTMPRVIYAGERVRAAGEHADDILLAAQVLEGHHAAAAHHHFERLVARSSPLVAGVRPIR